MMLFETKKSDWKQLFIIDPKYESFVREFIEPLLEIYLNDPSQEYDLSNTLSRMMQPSCNKYEHKVHPIVNNKLANRLFKDLHFNEYTIEESDRIVQQNTKPATLSDENNNPNSFTSMVEMDSTHWKSRRLLVEDTEQDETTLYSLRIKESLSQYSRSFQRYEKVFLSDKKAATEHHIKNDAIRDMRNRLSQFRSSLTSGLKENREKLYSFITHLFETWVSNVRIQYLDDNQFKVEKSENRTQLMKLVVDALLVHLEMIIRELSNNPNDENLKILSILHARAFYSLIEKARRGMQKLEAIYSYLRHRVVLNKFFLIILQCGFLYPLVRAVFKKEESMIKEELRLKFHSINITDLRKDMINFRKI
ncbi:hypothetical protein FDP41_004220 [Naegleria fowleri]|uniref:Uncharacterized protein n=1 Tax=Naegleria fowleri TaxID=5763 RepID=A0A6A5BUC1_NAEFO|nr:uncharacterized protein FDP41_004220 [Naegleria fowleri]KAF0976925.1 hypothetical protein FDP41_004220 [Naegleria fowleri]